MTAQDKIDLIKQARDDLREAEEIKCTCPDYIIMVDECKCERYIKTREAEIVFWTIIDGL